jgi:hypothetical protein
MVMTGFYLSLFGSLVVMHVVNVVLNFSPLSFRS